MRLPKPFLYNDLQVGDEGSNPRPLGVNEVLWPTELIARVFLDIVLVSGRKCQSALGFAPELGLVLVRRDNAPTKEPSQG